MTIVYMLLALWVAAGIVQMRVNLKLLTNVGAEVMLKHYPFKEYPDVEEKVKAMRKDFKNLPLLERDTCYKSVLAVLYVFGAILGGKGAIKYRFQPSPGWVELVNKLNQYHPVNRF